MIDTPEKMGWELIGQCFNLKVEEKVGDTAATFTLNFMGYKQSCRVPIHEMQDQKAWHDAWQQLLSEMMFTYALGAEKILQKQSSQKPKLSLV
ncbi:MAG TPA: hypothetical protein DCE71_07830, partial [Parachlamydiales bacterium]|nr:hypothetical protein [Parachlamydiales bacterium]